MKYLRVDHQDLEQHPHLSRLIWQDQAPPPYHHHAQFYAVREDNPAVIFILAMTSDPVWYTWPSWPQDPVKIFI